MKLHPQVALMLAAKRFGLSALITDAHEKIAAEDLV
jgi:hypothetical protein